MKLLIKGISLLLTMVLIVSTLATPVAAGRGNGRGQERQSEQQIYYLDAEVRVINGKPVITIETEKGYTYYNFPWPEVALVDGEKVALERQGNYFLLPTDEGIEKVSIEEFQVALVKGQLMLAAEINPLKLIPIAVVVGKLKLSGVAISTATVKAATTLLLVGVPVSAKTITAAVALQKAGVVVTASAVSATAALQNAGIAVTSLSVNAAAVIKSADPVHAVITSGSVKYQAKLLTDLRFSSLKFDFVSHFWNKFVSRNITTEQKWRTLREGQRLYMDPTNGRRIIFHSANRIAIVFDPTLNRMITIMDQVDINSKLKGRWIIQNWDWR